MIDLKTLKIKDYTYAPNYDDANLHSLTYIYDENEDDWIELVPDFENEDLVVLLITIGCSITKVVVLNMTQYEQNTLENTINSYINKL